MIDPSTLAVATPSDFVNTGISLFNLLVFTIAPVVAVIVLFVYIFKILEALNISLREYASNLGKKIRESMRVK